MAGYVGDVSLEDFAAEVLNLLVQEVKNAAHLAGPFLEQQQPVNLPVTADPWFSPQFHQLTCILWSYKCLSPWRCVTVACHMA